MEYRRWHAAYPPGIGIDIERSPGETLASVISQSIKERPHHAAVVAGQESLTYADLGRLSERLASHWRAGGLRKGERVALMLPNSLAFVVALVAILDSGLVAVPVNPLYTQRELAQQLLDAGVRCIVLASALREKFEGAIFDAGVQQILTAPVSGLLAELTEARPAGDVPVADSRIGALATAIAQAPKAPAPDVELLPGDPAFLQYTGGTTGLSKGAILTHGGFCAGTLQTLSWYRLALDVRQWSVVIPLPLYHVYPLHMALLTLRVAGTMRLIANPRDPVALISELGRAPFPIFIGVNTLFNALVNIPELRLVDFSETRVVMAAGASVQQAVSQRWQAAGGPPITEAYGLTETSGGVTFNPIGRNGSIGLPVPSTDVRVVDAEGRVVPDGMPGELTVKGPQLFAGYWNREDENRKVMTEDGFFRTGDIVIADGTGAMTVVDRKKDTILVSGFNVYPNEIEAVVALHDGVLECACVGRPDARSGEAPHLFVVRRDQALTAADVEAHCRQSLTGYKVPRQITFVQALPKSTAGKVLRRELPGHAN